MRLFAQNLVRLPAGLALTAWLAGTVVLPAAPALLQTWQGPAALALCADGHELFAACARGHCILVLDSETLVVTASIPVPATPTGLALSANGQRLYVTCAAPAGSVLVVDIPQRKVLRRIPAGHTAMAPVLCPDETRLFVCNRFNNDVSVINVVSGKEVSRIPVDREPVAAALTPDGKVLVVANHLHSGRADAEPGGGPRQLHRHGEWPVGEAPPAPER